MANPTVISAIISENGVAKGSGDIASLDFSKGSSGITNDGENNYSVPINVGATTLLGNGVPDNALGADGDFYLDESVTPLNNLYVKNNSIWSVLIKHA